MNHENIGPLIVYETRSYGTGLLCQVSPKKVLISAGILRVRMLSFCAWQFMTRDRIQSKYHKPQLAKTPLLFMYTFSCGALNKLWLVLNPQVKQITTLEG